MFVGTLGPCVRRCTKAASAAHGSLARHAPPPNVRDKSGVARIKLSEALRSTSRHLNADVAPRVISCLRTGDVSHLALAGLDGALSHTTSICTQRQVGPAHSFLKSRWRRELRRRRSRSGTVLDMPSRPNPSSVPPWTCGPPTRRRRSIRTATLAPGTRPFEVTVMSNLSKHVGWFISDVGSWDTSKVNRLFGMFFGCTVFDQDTGDWDVSSVSNMEVMNILRRDRVRPGYRRPGHV